MQIVIVDIDNVIADFNKACSARFGPMNNKVFSMQESYPNVPPSEFEKFLNDPQMILGMDLIPGADLALQALASEFKLVALSSRSNVVYDETLYWFDRKKILGYFQSVVLLGATESKAPYAINVGASMAIEDSPSQIEGYNAAGIPVVVIDYPYNAHIKKCLMRINTLFDLI